ncbi:MAG: SDR family oxidoreductase [Candidatus Heimdallarchaeota archaeon]|nr:SDR family oxidoreductase [Candidatus Heimdallarchaeota archaeon]
MNILITGASSGIGAALAKRLVTISTLLDDGHNIYLTGRSEKKLQALADDLRAHGSLVYFQKGEVGNTEDAKRICNDVLEKMKHVDILILNAGTGEFGNIEDMTDEQYDKMFDTNVKGVFLYIRGILPSMLERNAGQIIVTSSNLGLNTAARGAVYSASKHAVQGMIGSLRKQLKGTFVKAATINPGSVDTEWFKDHDQKKPKPHRIDVDEVVDAFMLIINQGARSNIEHILLQPTYE